IENKEFFIEDEKHEEPTETNIKNEELDETEESAIPETKSTIEINKNRYVIGIDSTKNASGETDNKNKIADQPNSKKPKNDKIETKQKGIETHKKMGYKYPEPQIIDSTIFIELNREEFEKFGFTIQDNSIELSYNHGNMKIFIEYIDGRLTYSRLHSLHAPKKDSTCNFQKNHTKISPEDINVGLYLMGITNDEGRNLFKIRIQESTLKTWVSKKFLGNCRTVFPIVMKKNTFGNEPKEDIVFWFLPTDEFFNHLPQNIGEDLLAEYDYINAEDKSTLEKPECKYFDECKNTLDVSNFKVFPNPANSNATVTFMLNETINGKISLVDLAGRERQVLQPQTTLSSGNHRFDLDVSDVPEGIYLITLYSDKGIQTQRFIISR
ncbi:MAG: T9SS type A sorting domain-containing protein, partial [Prolixibacteraceae bacterium]|nr:T9SS type A sorting domain-containing protein [Prolixibacteraceae bacterium]